MPNLNHQPAVRAALQNVLRASALSLAVLAATPIGLVHGQQQAGAQHYLISGGPLAQQLHQFASDAGITLSFEPVLVDGKSGPGLAGRYTAEEGLQALLAGSGLEVVRQEAGFTLRAAPQHSAAEQVQLAPVTVTARETALAEVAQERGYRVYQSAASGYRRKPLLDTPFSVAAIPAEVIRDQQAQSLIQVTKNDPSVVPINSPLWYDRVSVRGFGLGHDSYHREGFAANDQAQMAMENKASVEVLKGLSALRYGSVSPGGVVNYVVKRPPSEPLSRVNLYGNGFGGKGIHGDFGTRFGADEQFGARVNMAAEDVHTHMDEIRGDKQFFSTFLDWRASEQLLLEFDFEYQAREMTGYSGLQLSSFQNIEVARALYSKLKPDTNTAEKWSKAPTSQTYYGGALHYQFLDQWKLKLAAQQQYLKMDQNSVSARNMNADGDYDVWLYYAPDQERPYSGWQAVIEGDLDTGPLRHELAFGVDGARRDLRYPVAFSQRIGSDNLFGRTGTAQPLASVNPAEALVRYDQSSRFLTDTLNYSDWLQVYLGVRHTELDSFSRSAAGVKGSIYQKSALNPTLGVVVKPMPELSLYASYAEGIEQGGIAPVTAVNANEVMSPLESEQYEIGAKYELPHGSLLTFALFQIDKGLQYVDASNRYVQNGRQVHKGAELTLSGQVSDNLRAVAGLAYLDARVEETTDRALIGKSPQGVPDWQANLFADYDLGRFLPGLSANGGLYYSGEKAIDSLNTWMADDYLRVDVGLRYQQRLSAGTTATYRMNVENLADERYLANTTWGYLDFGAPRTVKLAVELDF